MLLSTLFVCVSVCARLRGVPLCRVPMLHLHLYMHIAYVESPSLCLSSWLLVCLFSALHSHTPNSEPLINTLHNSCHVSSLYQQQQQIAVKQYKIRARVRDRDQYFTFAFARHQIFQAQIEAGQTLFVYHISYFYFRHNKDYKLQSPKFLIPIFCILQK